MIKPDQIIGRHYKIIAQLGVGGMGQVYKALDVNLGREVAVKFLLEAESNEEIRQRFINEGRVLATINHRAVISVYASDIDEGLNVPFLVMEFVDGKPIDRFRDQYLENQTLLFEHFVELLDGISACHQKGIIHRDIKPANILANRDGQLKILDFGIAKTAKKQTKTGVALGTPHYMAPEQCLGKADVTHKVDIYAIGVMFWEFLTGKLPFDAGDSAADPALAIALMHLNEPPPIEVITSNPSISRFADLLVRMLAKKPDNRPEVSEVMETLRKELVCTIPSSATGPITAVPSSASGRRGAVRLIGDIYQIQRELGSGGMGTVFLALDTSLNRQVAIKLMNESNSRDTALVERFIREGQLLATVGHPNIMNIYASAIDPESGRPFLVMEYIDGVSLSSLKQNLLKERRNVPALMLQLFEGIAACHARGIIHRDLKPSNIMVTRAGMLKVLDFGIAKTSSNITKTGITMGTPEYMSPEQCMGVKDLTPASDVYTMGVIFWELIYGDTPFKPDNAENPELSIAMKHVHATLPAGVLIPDESFAPLLPLVRKMLDKSPAARPRLDELIHALDAYVEANLDSSQALPATRRKSRSMRTSGLQELLSGAENAEGGSFLKRRSTWLGAGGIAVAAALSYAFFLGRPDNTKLLSLLKAQLEQQLAAGQLQEAVRTLTDLESEPGGTEAVAPFRGRLAELLSEKARASVAAGNASPALSLYDLARQIDPGNATAAGGFARVKASIDAMIAAEANRARLLKRSRELLPLILPGSGTEELAGLLGGLRQEGLATEATSIESAWTESFLSSGDAALASDPTRALEFFDEIRKRFSSTTGIDERIAAARKRQEEEQARLRKSRETADLVARLDQASRAFTPESDPTAFLALCDALAQMGERATADRYRRAAAARLFEAAEAFLASGKKSEAVQAMKRAAGIFSDLPGLGDRLRQTEDLIASEIAAAERAAALGKRLSDISAEIQSLRPPAPVDALLTEIGEVETTFAAASDAAGLRRMIFDRYLSAARGARDTAPDTALAILAECGKTGVSADLVASETSSVKQLIAARDAADAERKRAAELEKQVGVLSSEIRSLAPPAPVDTLLTRIGEVETAFGAASAAAELRQAIFDRYLSAAQNRRDSDPESAMAILAECRKTGIQPDTVASKASSLSQRVAERAAQAATQKRITDVSAELSILVKNPGAKGGGAIQALLDELSKLGEAEKAASFRASALEVVRKQAGKARTEEDAQEIRRAMKGLVEAGSDEEKEISFVIEASLKAWRDKRSQEIVTALGNVKPAENVKPVVELLRELAAFDEQERVKTAAQALKNKYLEAASRLKQPSQAKKLLSAADGIPQLKGDPDLRSAIKAADEAIAEEARLSKAAELASQAAKPPVVIKPPPVEGRPPVATAAVQPPVQPPPLVTPPERPAEPFVGPGGFKSLAEAVAAATPGQTIRVKPGTYKGSCVVDKNVTILGDGSRASVILESGSGTVLTLSGTATVSGLTIAFTGTSQTDAVKITGGSPTVKNCTVTSTAAAAAPSWSACIAVDGGSPKIIGNVTNGSRGMGILARGGRPQISGNTCSGCTYYGAWFTDGAGGTFEGNTITRSGKTGLGIKSGASPAVRNNTISNNKENGILVYQGGAGTIQGNTLSDNGVSGVYVGMAGKAELIADNRISGNRWYGIHVTGNGSTAVIGSNALSGNAKGGEKADEGGKISRR